MASVNEIEQVRIAHPIRSCVAVRLRDAKNILTGCGADAIVPMRETKCETAWPSLFAGSGGYNRATVKAPNKYETNRMAHKYLYTKETPGRHSFSLKF